MRMPHRLLLPAAAAVLLTAACASTNGASANGSAAGSAASDSSVPVSGAAQASDYQPLAIGNRWTYRGTMGGQTVAKSITTLGIDQGFFVDDAGGRMKIDRDGLRDDKRYLLKNPIARGSKWMAVVSPSSTERYEITGTDVTVETPAGKFEHCVVVHASNRIDSTKQLENEWTYAPGVGIVKIETKLRDGSQLIPQALVELVSHRLEAR